MCVQAVGPGTGWILLPSPACTFQDVETATACPLNLCRVCIQVLVVMTCRPPFEFSGVRDSLATMFVLEAAESE